MFFFHHSFIMDMNRENISGSSDHLTCNSYFYTKLCAYSSTPFLRTCSVKLPVRFIRSVGQVWRGQTVSRIWTCLSLAFIFLFIIQQFQCHFWCVETTQTRLRVYTFKTALASRHARTTCRTNKFFSGTILSGVQDNGNKIVMPQETSDFVSSPEMLTASINCK